MNWTYTVPDGGEPITQAEDGALLVPDRPIIPFIEGDGTGPDIWAAAQRVLDAAVANAYGSDRKIAWMEVLAGEKAHGETGDWLPEPTLEAINKYRVAIKGPLTTPVGGGIRSLNVALRQILDLYVCLRPVKYYAGVPTPVLGPERHDWVVFRENTEDIYAGIEWTGGSNETQKVIDFLQKEFPEAAEKIRFGSKEQVDGWEASLAAIGAPKRGLPVEVGIGLKPVSRLGTERLVHSAIAYAIREGRESVTLVHKGNIMKFTEGGFRDWGYQTAVDFFGAEPLDGGPWHVIRAGNDHPVVKTLAGGELQHDIIIKDVIADAMLQQVLTRPDEYDVVATLNLNGDYLSDALAACVGGIGIAPGANINFVTGHAIFEATHGTAPKYAGMDKVNPGSVILSGVMMLRHMGWNEAAERIEQSLATTIGQKRVTYDFERLMEGATLLKCSEFGDALIENMQGTVAREPAAV